MTDATNVDGKSVSGEPKTDISPASVSESVPGGNRNAEKQENTSAAQSTRQPDVEAIATAYNPQGQQPRCVVDFNHGSGYRARRLLPVPAFASAKRARDALAKAGIPLAIASDDAMLAAIVNGPPQATGMYNVQHGWSHGCDVGAIYRYGDTAYSSSGPITVYADGLVPEPQQNSDISKLTEALMADCSLGTVIVMAIHLASPLVHLLGCKPIVIVVSGVSILEAERLAALADSAFDTTPTAIHARRKDASDALVQFVSVKSRKQAFAHAQTPLEAGATEKGRDNKIGRTHAPVTLILATETDSPRNLASPTPPPGCIEIHLGASSPDVPSETAHAPSHKAVQCKVGATKAYIEAVLRVQDAVSRNADTKLPKFVERYWGMVKGQPNDGAVSAAIHVFAVLRYALRCGSRLNILPWSGETVDRVMDASVKQWAERRRERVTAFDCHVINAVKKLANPGNPSQRATFNDREVCFNTVSGRDLMLIEPGTFDTYVVATLDKARVLDSLRKRRLLVTNGDGAQFQKRVGSGRPRFYAIDALALQKT
jgi:hypothetical protein